MAENEQYKDLVFDRSGYTGAARAEVEAYDRALIHDLKRCGPKESPALTSPIPTGRRSPLLGDLPCDVKSAGENRDRQMKHPGKQQKPKSPYPHANDPYASGEGHLPLFVGLRDNAAISDGGLYDGGDSGAAV